MGNPPFSRDALRIDGAAEIDRIAAGIREHVLVRFRRRGAVVAVSGGIDSSVVAALCVRALGRERVLALELPEAESSPETLEASDLVCRSLGVERLREDITPALAAFGCYRRRDDAIRATLPEYGPGWRCKIVLPSVVASDAYRLFSVVARAPDGREVSARLPPEAYLQLVAASNFKQRTRKAFEYYHAERLHYAVAGTANRLEHDQGFFVKNGDGAADLFPIAHLYKGQVYALAELLDVPDAIRRRPPTTDTYSLPQSQEEFFFSLPWPQMDLCLWARDHGISPEAAAEVVDLAPAAVQRVFRDIDSKRRHARYLHAAPALLGETTAAAAAPGGG